MELNDSQKEIIKLIKMKKSAFEIIRNRVQFKLNNQDVSKIQPIIRLKDGSCWTADFNDKTGIIINQNQSDELNKQIEFINNLLSLLDKNELIKLEKIDSSSKYVIYIKENDNKYIKDLKSESALTKFEQQNIVPSKYFSKFAKNFRTQDEETRYKNEKFDKLRNGKVVWIVSFLCLLLSTLFAFLGVYSCSTNKTKSENNNTNQDLPKTPDFGPDSSEQINI